MKVFYTDFSKAIGFNYKDNNKPLYITDPIIFIVEYAHNKRIRQKIPRYFCSDGCTIPSCFWLLIGCPHSTKYIPASFIHDYILSKPEIVNHNLEFSSKIFLQCLLNEGVHPFKAKLMTNLMTFWQAVTNWKHQRWS